MSCEHNSSIFHGANLTQGWELHFRPNMTWIGINMPQHVPNLIWLVVSTVLKNISQWEGLSHILWKIKHVPNHQSVIIRSKSSSFSRVPQSHVAKRGDVSVPWWNRSESLDPPSPIGLFLWTLVHRVQHILRRRGLRPSDENRGIHTDILSQIIEKNTQGPLLCGPSLFLCFRKPLCQDTKNLDATPSLCKVRPKGVTTLRQPQSAHGQAKVFHPNSRCLQAFPFCLWLVGGAITILINIGEWEGWHSIHEMEHNPFMFETTNQMTMFSGISTIPPHTNQPELHIAVVDLLPAVPMPLLSRED